MGSLADFWSPLRCDSVDHISHTSHRPNVLTAYFLMRGRTQSVCGVKSTICLHSPVSCAVHSHPLLLTQNKDGLVSLFIKQGGPLDQIPVETPSTAKCMFRGMSSLWALRCPLVQNRMKQNIGQFLGDGLRSGKNGGLALLMPFVFATRKRTEIPLEFIILYSFTICF